MAKKAKTKKTPRLISSCDDLPQFGKARKFFIKDIQPYIDNKNLDLKVHHLTCTLQNGSINLKNRWFEIKVLKEDNTILFDTRLHADEKKGIMVPFTAWEESRNKPKKNLLVEKKEFLSSLNQGDHKNHIIDFNESDEHAIADNKFPETSLSPSSYPSPFNFFTLPTTFEPKVDNFNFDVDRLNQIPLML